MVQENTSNTDAEIEMKEYPAPRPLNRVGIKVGLGMGLLLSLFAFAGLVSLFQARIVDEKVREITEVAEPASAAAYEMEINVIGTGSGVLKYLQTGDDIHRQRVAKHEADFERFKAQYDLLAETPRGRQLGDRVSLLYQEYKVLGDTLMDQADQREVMSATIGENFEELDGILDQQIQANIDLQTPDGPEKLLASIHMEADIAEVGTWLGSYLRDPKEGYKLRILGHSADFWQEFDQFKSYRLTEEEAGWAVELEDLFSQTQALSIEIVALEDNLDANLAALVDLRTRLDAVLDDEIQVLTYQDLAEANQVARDMKARTTTLVLLLLLGGLACGTLVAVAITRGITDPVDKLVAASRAIARGDLSPRANIQSKDEFGILGDAFNEMTVQRQRAQDELEVRVQERTAELSRINEEMDLANEVARIVTSTLNIDEVYQKFALEVKKMVDFDRMNINIIDYERGIYEIKYHFGEEAPQRPVSFTGPLEGTTTGQVAITGRTLVQHDIALAPRSPVGEKYLKMGLHSNIKVPLIIKGRVIGTLGLRSNRVGAYSQQEQAILERLASQIAPAVETSQLYLRLQASMEEMDLADEVARIVTSTLNIDEVYQKFALEVKKLVDFDRMNINLIDHETGVFTVKYLVGEDMPGREVGRARPLANTRTQHIIETGRTLVQPDITKDSQFPGSLADAKVGLLSSIMVPLVTKGQVIGVMRMRSRLVGCYGPREQAILERLASHIAPALETSQLYLRLQASMEEMDLADEVARIVTSTLNIDEVYEKFALEVKKLVDYDRMNINVIDHEAGVFMVKYLVGEELPGRQIGRVRPLADTWNQHVIETGRTLVRADIDEEIRFPGDLVDAEAGLRSRIMVPLITKGQVLGSISMRSCRANTYGPREQAILERLASHIAPAIENSQLYGRLQATMEEMDLADEVGRIVTSTLNIDEVYEKFALELKKLVDFDRMNINIIDSTTQTFLIKYLSGPSLPGREKGDVVPLVGTKTQWIFTTGQAFTPADSSKEQNNGSVLADIEERYLKLGLRSCIAVPLISNGSVIGTMILRSCKMGYYGGKEQAILERLASQMAPAMENARLHEERVRAEEQLSHAQKMESVGRLAGGVAHDFNNLLTAIMGYTQLSLGETPDESNIGSHLREIQKATQRATNLTNQLLTFSRHQVIEPKVIDLNDLIIDLDKMLRRLIGEDIELVTLPAPDLDRVKVDRGQMEQVLMNLAVNAQDAMPTGGKITVETANVIQDADYALRDPGASPGRLVMLSVSDTGTGIPQEVRDHIFEPFFTTKDIGKGTGLGLSTCYGIIQQSGGHIEVESEPGQGTSFKVYLPVTDESYEAQLPQADTCILPQGQETVLLAEDEPLVRSMVATVLRDRGYLVLETANGAEALGMVQKHEGEDIQLLLTDVVMPQMSGPELAEQIWATHPDIKVLFTSGYTGDSISSVNNYPKSSNFLPKPYLPEALVVKVREVLDQRAA